MVKSSKRQQQLHDILGLRVIVTESVLPWNRPTTSTSTSTIDCDTEMSTLEAEEVDPLRPLDSTVATEDRVVDLDDYLFDDFSETYDEDEDIHKEYAVWRVHDVITQSLSDTDSSGNIKVSDALLMESDETLEASEGNTDTDSDSDSGVLTSSSSSTNDSMSEWDEDVSRFKDYVTEPKPSGYQSLHMTLMHRQTGIRLEVQIRSQRMHLVAEYGSAAHRNYKALALPVTTSAKWRTD